jgi:ribosome-associated translation inhibitor RaiA
MNLIGKANDITYPIPVMQAATLRNINAAQIIAIKDLPTAIGEMIQTQIARLKREYTYILGSDLSVIIPALHQAGTYQIQIVIALPDGELQIDRQPIPDCYQEDIYVAIWSAFDLARKKLKEYSASIDYEALLTPSQKAQTRSIRTIRRCRGYAQG